MEVPTHLKFKIWYSDIFDLLEHRSDHGNGAVIALMGAMPLYERWVCANCSPNSYTNRMALIDSDLDFNDLEKTKKFWNVVRDGLCHSGSFFEESKAQQDKKWTDLPRIGLNKQYPSKPTYFTDPETGKEAIAFNPWGLIEHILKKFEDDPSLLEGPEAPLLPLSYTLG